MDFQKDLVSQEVAAQLLRKSKAWMERARWAGTGPSFVRIGRSVWYLREDLDAFVTKSKRSNTREAV